MQADAVRRPSAEITRPVCANVVAHDGERMDAVMQPIEARGLELSETVGDDAAPWFDPMFVSVVEVDVDAVGKEVSAAKLVSIAEQFFDLESDRRIVRGDDGPRADTDNAVDWYAVANQLAKNTDMSGAAQAARAEHQSNTHIR